CSVSASCRTPELHSLPTRRSSDLMTAYSRLMENRPWENGMAERKWLYQTPLDILIKASNGASDFGNKFGQPLIAGSVLTFEHQRSEEHTSELQSRENLVCRLLLEK